MNLDKEAEDMKKDILSQDFYLYLMNCIECGIEKVSYEKLKNFDNIVILGSNDKKSITNILEKVHSLNASCRVWMPVTSSMKAIVSDIKWENLELVDYDKGYNQNMIRKMEESGIDENIDALFFCSQGATYTRNINILEMALMLQDKNPNIKIYTTDYNECELYYYSKLALTYNGLKLFEAMNCFLNVALEEDL